MSVDRNVKYVSYQALSGQTWSVLSFFVPRLPFFGVNVENRTEVCLVILRLTKL